MVTVLKYQETMCCGCDELFEDDELQPVKDGMACTGCVEAMYVTCCACNEKAHDFESIYVGRTSERYCFDCAERLRVVDPDRVAD